MYRARLRESVNPRYIQSKAQRIREPRFYVQGLLDRSLPFPGLSFPDHKTQVDEVAFQVSSCSLQLQMILMSHLNSAHREEAYLS